MPIDDARDDPAHAFITGFAVREPGAGTPSSAPITSASCGCGARAERGATEAITFVKDEAWAAYQRATGGRGPDAGPVTKPHGWPVSSRRPPPC